MACAPGASAPNSSIDLFHSRPDESPKKQNQQKTRASSWDQCTTRLALTPSLSTTFDRDVQPTTHNNHDCNHIVSTLMATPSVTTFKTTRRTTAWASRPLSAKAVANARALRKPLPSASGHWPPLQTTDDRPTTFHNNSGQKVSSDNSNDIDPIGRTGIIKFSHAEWGTFEVDSDVILGIVDKRASRAKVRSSSRATAGYAARSLGKSLVAARELADKLDVPKRSRTMETNRRWPIYWSQDWRAEVMIPNPLNGDMFMDTKYSFPIVARDVAIKFALHDWDAYLHSGCIPNDIERNEYMHLDTYEACQFVWSRIHFGRAG